MAQLEVIALDTAVPQLRAPAAGDTYSVPRDMTLASGTTLTAPTVDATTGNITTVNATTVDATNVEVTNVKAKDGTAAITIADSTGNVGLSANLTFSSTAQRITGDFSNATQSNRLSFQSSTTNGNTAVHALPNGTSQISAFNVFNNSDPTNAAFFQLQATSAEARLTSTITGTGTYIPMAFFTGGSERMRLDTSGNLGIGVTPSQKLDVAGTSRYTFNVGNAYTLQSSTNAAGSAFADDYKNALSHIWQTSGSERMRIDSSGNVGIGGTAAQPYDRLETNGTLPLSGNISVAFNNRGTVPDGASTAAYGHSNNLFTAAASFTIANYYHYFAFQQTLGAGSAVTNQHGYYVDPSLTGATNNYGFYSNIASGSGRYNFFANGSADNYFAGNVGIGALAGGAVGDEKLRVKGTDTDSFVVTWEDSVGGSLGGLYANASVVGVGSVTSVPLILQTNQAERMRIDSSGNVGIGGTAGATTKLDVLGTLPSSSNTSLGLNVRGTIPSSSTGFALSYQSNTSVENASFTLTNWIHFGAYQGTKGASATVTNQYGFLVDSTLTGATNNYGFYSNIASGSNRWNLYCAGTAENYVANNLKIGGTAARATTAGTNQLVLFDGTAPVGTLANGVSFYSSSGEANVMDAAGNATLLSPHDSETNEWIFRSKHTPTGKVLKIDVEKMLRFINEHFDLDMVHEFTE